jgi:hypothetical protein
VTRPITVCFDAKHQYLCFLPCDACDEDCDRTKRRLATDEELELYANRDEDGFRGVVNPEH